MAGDTPVRDTGPGVFVYILVAGLLGGGLYAYDRHRNRPPPPKLDVQVNAAKSLSRPSQVPGPARRVEGKRAKADSSSLVLANPNARNAAAHQGMYANSIPPPPLSFEGEGGPAALKGALLRDRKAWFGLWDSVGAHDIPTLDFTKHMGVALFGGEQPRGTRVQIISAKPAKKRVVVRYRIIPPEEKYRGTSRPYHVVVVPASRFRPVFRRMR